MVTPISVTRLQLMKFSGGSASARRSNRSSCVTPSRWRMPAFPTRSPVTTQGSSTRPSGRRGHPLGADVSDAAQRLASLAYHA